MPEGDVVWQTARRLHQALAGRTLTRSDFRVPQLATVDLTGGMVTETTARGG
jgi:endonuclease-8